MKLTAITTALSTAIILAIATPIAAEEVAPAQTDDEAVMQLCTNVGSFAETVMTHRQSGTAMSQLMGLMATDDLDAMAYMRAIIKDAYNQPQFYTDEMQADAVKRFRNSSESLCFDKFDKP